MQPFWEDKSSLNKGQSLWVDTRGLSPLPLLLTISETLSSLNDAEVIYSSTGHQHGAVCMPFWCHNALLQLPVWEDLSCGALLPMELLCLSFLVFQVMAHCCNRHRAFKTFVQYCLTVLAKSLIDVKSTQPSHLVDHSRTTAWEKCLRTYYIQ